MLTVASHTSYEYYPTSITTSSIICFVCFSYTRYTLVQVEHLHDFFADVGCNYNFMLCILCLINLMCA